MIQQTQLTHTPIPRKRRKRKHISRQREKKSTPSKVRGKNCWCWRFSHAPLLCKKTAADQVIRHSSCVGVVQSFSEFFFTRFQAACALASALFAHNFPNKSLLLDSASRSVCSVLLGVKLVHAGRLLSQNRWDENSVTLAGWFWLVVTWDCDNYVQIINQMFADLLVASCQEYSGGNSIVFRI